MEPIKQSEQQVIYRPEQGNDWYAAACLNFTTGETIQLVNYEIPTGESIYFQFVSAGSSIGSLYVGQNSAVGNVEKSGEINGLKFDYFQDEDERRYFFHTELHENTFVGTFFELSVVKGHESEMKTVLESIRIGSPMNFSLDYDSPGKIVLHPISGETKSFTSNCHQRWDLGREYREGFDIVAFFRNRWYDIGADWIPLEGETGYPNIPEHLKR